MAEVREEQSLYLNLPRYHSFGIPEKRERFLMDHLKGCIVRWREC
jgi:hypothetical protein